jgi:signal transduction histidine kinase
MRDAFAESRRRDPIPGEAVNRRRVRTVRVLLLALLMVLFLLIALTTLIVGAEALSRVGIIALLVLAVLVLFAVVRLGTGRLGQAVGLVILGVLGLLALQTAEAGIAGSASYLIAFAVPIAFAGLLAGRWSLLGTSIASVAIVIAVHLLERSDSPWVAYDADPTEPSTIVIIFGLIVGLLTLVLDRFGVEIKDAHGAALERERDLALLVDELENQIEERKEAEAARESSNTRLRLLAEAGHVLSASLDFGETLKRLTGLVVPECADWFAVDIVDSSGKPRRLILAHSDPEKVRWARQVERRYLVEAGDATVGAAIETGSTQYIAEVGPSDLRFASRTDDHLRFLQELGIGSLVIVPLKIRGTSLGALTLVAAESGRRFSAEDVVFFEELAARAAAAVDNARLFGEIRALNQELEARVEERTRDLSNALSELEAFSYSVSHDLRAPLRGIDGFSQALLEDYAGSLDETGVQYLERIRGGARRMGDLIEDLLKLSRLSQGELLLDEVDLGAMAEAILSELAAKDRDRNVEVTIEPELTAVADPRLLRVALQNLISNAWKFTSRGERARIEIGAKEHGGETVFYVRDNGTGFDMQYADKLFAPFQRLHSPNQFEGSGIGLATVQRVLRRHGGRIWAESEEGEGATFYFTLGGS